MEMCRAKTNREMISIRLTRARRDAGQTVESSRGWIRHLRPRVIPLHCTRNLPV
jgi:hypothetical protein